MLTCLALILSCCPQLIFKLRAQAVHSTQPWAATGFEKSMLRVWDLSTQQATYSPLAPKGNRKQAPHDPYASSLAFLVS